MTNFTRISKILAGMAALSMALAATASAMGPKRPKNTTQLIPTGSYEGQSDRGDATHLLIKPLAGRSESYLGLLIGRVQGRVYVIDPITVGSSYAMTPLQITEDGETGVVDENPSLVLNLDGLHDNGWPGFTVSDAKSGNTLGFQGSIAFTAGSLSRLVWEEFTPALYRTGLFSGPTLTLSALDGNHQATAFFSGGRGELNGSFFVREKAPGVFTLHDDAVKSTGPEVKEVPSKALVFVSGRAIVVSTQDGAVIGRFKR